MLQMILDLAIFTSQIKNLENKNNIEILEIHNSKDNKDITFIKLKILSI